MFESLKDKLVIKELKREVVELQHSVNILIGQNETTFTRGNPYTDHETAIAEVAKKYEGTAQWGVQQVRNIIDVRAAFTIGQGIKAVDKDKSETKSRELMFIEEFIKANDLDEEGPIDLAKEAEIEGRCLVKLFFNEETKMVEYRFVSYSVNSYTINADKNDYKKYLSAVYRNSATQQNVELATDEFIYKKFAGRIEKVNEVMPKVALTLRQCEDLDKALSDWREMNKFFASPTPYFECADMEMAKKMNDAIKLLNWKIGKAFAGVGSFTLVGMTDTGKDSLEKEIITNAKMISGNVGIPIHFLGFPDLMSNRATSTDLFELIMASTAKDRLVWAGFYEEMFDKVLKKANKNFKPGQVKAELLQVSDAKIQELTSVWLPLYTGGVIDLNYMLSKIPDIDPVKVKKALEAAQLKMVEDIKAQEEEGDEA